MQEYCFEYGEFTLSSGLPSKYYYDGKRATLDPYAASLIGKVLTDVVISSGAECVGGLEIGSVPIAVEVGQAALAQQRDLPTFIVRKAQKEHGTRDSVAQAYTRHGDLLRPGRRVAIVDDVITTGGSVSKAIDAVKQLGCEIVLVAVLVERHEGGAEDLRARYDVVSLFRSDETGHLSVNPDFVRRLEAARAAA